MLTLLFPFIYNIRMVKPFLPNSKGFIMQKPPGLRALFTTYSYLFLLSYYNSHDCISPLIDDFLDPIPIINPLDSRYV